jgi:hypothetical protein
MQVGTRLAALAQTAFVDRQQETTLLCGLVDREASKRLPPRDLLRLCTDLGFSGLYLQAGKTRKQDSKNSAGSMNLMWSPCRRGC